MHAGTRGMIGDVNLYALPAESRVCGSIPGSSETLTRGLRAAADLRGLDLALDQDGGVSLRVRRIFSRHFAPVAQLRLLDAGATTEVLGDVGFDDASGLLFRAWIGMSILATACILLLVPYSMAQSPISLPSLLVWALIALASVGVVLLPQYLARRISRLDAPILIDCLIQELPGVEVSQGRS